MKIANNNGRLCLVIDESPDGITVVDVAKASDGRFSADPQLVFKVWKAFIKWAANPDTNNPEVIDRSALRAPVPAPRQIFAVGMNYAAHISELGRNVQSQPTIFTKFPSCITGPDTDVNLPTSTVDYEVELVVVIAVPTRHASQNEALSRAAGVMIGQDLSERTMQFTGEVPQYSLAKSFEGFGPTGPYITTLDQADVRNLAISSAINGETMQDSNTANMLFGIDVLIEHLSSVTTLLPGDLIFTGTPAGVGHGRDPKRYLNPGDHLVSRIDGLGELNQRFDQDTASSPIAVYGE